jgi:hypothetical protein
VKTAFRFLVITFVVSACGQRDVLIENNWILIGGTFKDKGIEFKSTGPVFLTEQNGQIIRSLNFDEDQTIILPGINSGDIRAKWAMERDSIRFFIDSTHYTFDTFDPAIFEKTDSTQKKKTVNEPNEFEEPMKVYGRVFSYSISRDTLRLFSKDVNLWAVRDRRVDELLKHLK